MQAWPVEIIRERDAVLVDGEPQARYLVIAIHEEKAWVRAAETGQDSIVFLSACQRLSTFH